MSSSTSPPSKGSGAFTVAGDRPRRRRPLWLAALVAVIVVVALVLLLSRCNGDSNNSSSSPTASTAAKPPGAGDSSAAAAPGSTTPSPTPSATVTPSGTATAVPPATTGSGSLTAGATSLLPLTTSAGAGGDLTRYGAQVVTAKNVRVLSAPADNGFWVGTSTADQVWVQLLLPGLVSPHPVRAEDRVSFTGTMVANPADFATTAGVTPDTGASLLTAQRAHIEVAKTAIAFAD